MESRTRDGPVVGLFATCLVDLFRPTVGFAALRLLEQAGCRVVVPLGQTCCGQPAYNAGDRQNAAEFARSVIELFHECEHVVVPSGSCAATMRKDFPLLLAGDPGWAERARIFAARCHELVGFLVDVLGVESVDARCPGVATYHDSCSGLRSLGIEEQPRRLLASVDGLELRPLADRDACCGFGGTFCVKYPEISNRMVEEKSDRIEATGASLLLAGDLGCLMNMAGKLRRRGSTIQVRHVAEVLAGLVHGPAIGEDGP